MAGGLVGRLGLTDISPVIGSTISGEHPARAVVGERVRVSAVVFREGHDAIGADVLVRDPTGAIAAVVRMEPEEPGTDRWVADIVASATGMWTFQIQAFSDPISSWQQAVTAKFDAGQSAAEIANDLEAGARLFDRLAVENAADSRAALAREAAPALRESTWDLAARLAPAFEQPLRALAHDHPLRELVTLSPQCLLWVDRQRALYGSWYEFFPRSIGAELCADPATPAKPRRHGNFATATAHLDYVASMGFDVVYLPPIHPIGTVNRKGANNSLTPAPWDVGSPWAVGSVAGGHDAIDPSLGTMTDFTVFVARARELGMEVALDFALQCAPDHPWVSAHPEWFTTKADGTIAYAENPPKKYQDIYPLNFDNDPAGLYAECLRILQIWMAAGVRIFRVDNPHTKPLNFWQWLIAEVRRTDPDVLFLAEAFTRPAMMHELAKIGFHQSYTYFTWRNERFELEGYARELVGSADFLRPNFFVNTPDILHEFLVTGGPAAFAIRATLAAMLSPAWGVYSGFELYENRNLRPGSEEYLDSEKYQLRPRDFVGAQAVGASLAPLITTLNLTRRAHPALQQLRNLRFHGVDNAFITAFSKRDPSTGDTILVVCNLDPTQPQEAMVTLDLIALGVAEHTITPGTSFTVHDLLSGEPYTWGARNYVRLDPARYPAHIFTITPGPLHEADPHA